eukprot:SM005355S17893  [mRNA]  locus=s5355:653:754:+ [translate_table: standard]
MDLCSETARRMRYTWANDPAAGKSTGSPWKRRAT